MPFIRLSSRVTLFHKLILPIGGLLAWGAYAGLVFAYHWSWELHGVVVPFTALLLALFFCLISLPIRHVSYNGEFIRVRNYGAAQLFPAQEYLLLEPAYLGLGLMRLSLVGGQRFLFLASFPSILGEVVSKPVDVLNTSSEPDYIVVARRTLLAARNKARSSSQLF